jgi:hypothetical protein
MQCVRFSFSDVQKYVMRCKFHVVNVHGGITKTICTGLNISMFALIFVNGLKCSAAFLFHCNSLLWLTFNMQKLYLISQY